MTAGWTAADGGVDWQLDLDRDRLLPGRLVDGRVSLTARRGVEARGLLVTLLGEEHWRYEVTTTDSEGRSHTERRTGRDDLPRVPVLLGGPIRLSAGERLEVPFQLPVPPLGPPTLEADVSGVTWTVEAKLDVGGGMDPSIEVPVRVLQPTALLRAGAVHVAQFALFPSADAVGDGVTGSIALDPVPLVPGEPFTGRVVVRLDGPARLQEVRAELRVKVEATVSGGLEETLTPWAAVLAPAGEVAGELAFDLAGTIDDVALPTAVLPHGRAWAELHVILARAWARDPHLVRDVAIATTREV
jgi:hypothetical protein